MQVNLDDNANVLVEKDTNSDGYLITVDSRVTVRVTKTELRLLQALIGAQLEDNSKAGRDGLKKVLVDALTTHRTKFEEALRRMRVEDIALAVWYVGDVRVTQEVLKYVSKRAADDVQDSVREAIDRRVRKERSTGNTVFEQQMMEKGKMSLINLLKLVLDTDTLPL